MPKAKVKNESEELDIEKVKAEPKDILIDDEEKVLDADLIPGDVIHDDEDEDEVSGLDDDEVDPFKDKWEE
jgi:hypothetical protein